MSKSLFSEIGHGDKESDSAMPSAVSTPRSTFRDNRSNWVPDAFLLLALVAVWIWLVLPIVTEGLRGYDIFRDIGSAVNVQHGRYIGDPAYPNETFWYPPLSPILVAGISALLDAKAADCYRWSQLLVNGWIPIGLFLIVRIQWGRRAAIFTTVALLLAMPWWQTEIAHGQPSIHAVIWGMAAVLMYEQQERRASMTWAVACGVLQGVSFWHHPFVPAALAGAFLVQGMWAARRNATQDDARAPMRASLWRHGVMLLVIVLISAPLLVQILRGPTLNPVPRAYLAHELQTVEYALMHGNPWLWAAGFAGVFCCLLRRDRGGRLLIAFLVITLAAQIPGYVRIYWGELAGDVPPLLPHEFQRLFQLGWAIAIGIGIDGALRALGKRVAWIEATPAARIGLTLAACLLTGAWYVRDVPANLRRYLMKASYPSQADGAAEWIREHTDIDDVFACEPDLAFRWLNPETGRKVLIMPDGHSNPRVDWNARAEVLAALEQAPTADAFREIALRHGVRYFIPSSRWNPRVATDPELRAAGLGKTFELAHPGGGIVPIYRIMPPATLEPSNSAKNRD